MALPALVSPQGWRVICTSDMGHYRPPIGDHFRGCCGRLLVLVFGLISGLTTGVALVSEALAGEDCRIAFDMGSSGIRAGASNHPATARAEIDFLAPLWAGRGLDELLPATAAALTELPRQAGFDTRCQRMGGGFSAWRLAAARDPVRLAAQLGELHAATGVAILVIPQLREGAYGYRGARQLLGERLTTTHILDIGGGSLQVAGESSTFGEPLGQKVWHRRLCLALGRGEPPSCQLQPLQPLELVAARALARAALQGVRPALGGPATMTAISRPVSRGVLPAVNRLLPRERDRHRLLAGELAMAIEQLAVRTVGDTANSVNSMAAYVNYLLSDMLLVEGLLAATESSELAVAEIDLTNLPGELADDKAYQWAMRHACYREKLAREGVAAFDGSPAQCGDEVLHQSQ